ncbi:MAG: efflux RND transporter periplasmic adaptor subunit [Candidatus Latescibacteria bacterium]|nr:efflux RND transporter periplasmic adaptor subunit [Candidatus Latescibacterota bacterium]NIM21817.1 efflux RND transporter periplasmic adaptor subunit [Candidatus Latescibacterota bacterium]NIM65955.1 efflux RND transporter periplasmic adaptor subunit [Candidatus Latescibacterota bacterium]NIO02700.1 efflux RND transporter periplasmic adaptor subunit [Candidatus Latescibacterota bacterium]NIO29681.1 efflux RND transporter periplasmic adaptor subunit [Candidatus Latescibacterota bacterium]
MTANRIARWVLIGVAAVVVILIAMRFATLRGREPAKSIDEIQAAEGFPVDVQVIQRGTVARYINVLGNVQGIEQVDIRSSLAIDVTGILKKEGDRVKKGEVVIRLARDRRGNAYHQYAMAKQALDNARSDLGRMENLYNEGAVSGQMLEQARLAYKNAKAQYDQAASMVDLISPISGIVTMVNATEGSTAIPGVPLATVAAMDRVRIRCYVGQEEVAQLGVGQRAFIRTTPSAASNEIEPARESPDMIEGTVSKVAMSADPETMLFLVEVTADNPEGLLKPGVVAALSVLVEERNDVIKVPVDALVRREEGDFIYLVRSNRAHLIQVSLGVDNRDYVEVETGAVDGDTLVFRGQYRLANDVPVKIRRMEGAN